jgi:acetyltransferase-like isoleucine patch superfamily enzyme
MKDYLQRLSFFIATALTCPLFIAVRIVGGDGLFCTFGQLLALFPGKTGSYLRVAYYGKTLLRCSDKVFIGFGSFFSHRNAVVGEGVYIGAYCIIGMAKIGKNCTLGSHVSVLSGKRQHGFDQVGVPIQEQGGTFEQVQLGENCWIGERSVIMADLGAQCVVGAGSVVTKSFDDLSIVGGNPAKILGQVGGL